MNLAEDIQPVTYLKGNAAHLLRQVNETRRPIIITQNGLARAVLQDTASYESMRNAIAMLKLMVQKTAWCQASKIASCNGDCVVSGDIGCARMLLHRGAQDGLPLVTVRSGGLPAEVRSP